MSSKAKKCGSINRKFITIVESIEGENLECKNVGMENVNVEFLLEDEHYGEDRVGLEEYIAQLFSETESNNTFDVNCYDDSDKLSNNGNENEEYFDVNTKDNKMLDDAVHKVPERDWLYDVLLKIDGPVLQYMIYSVFYKDMF